VIEYSWIDPQVALSALKLLFEVYVFGRKSSKTKSGPEPKKVQEVIEDLEAKTAVSAADVNARIDAKFSPTEAMQVKNDLAAISVIAVPPSFEKFDYWKKISNYLSGMQAIASRTDLFRFQGWSNQLGQKLLRLENASKVIKQSEWIFSAVHKYSDVVSAPLRSVDLVLTDKGYDPPALLAVRATFNFSSHTGYGDGGRENRGTVFRVSQGQDINWIGFEPLERTLGFQPFEQRLNAAEAKALIVALKTDLNSFLGDLKNDLDVVGEIDREVADLFNFIPRTS
jgi:hypothetical protein